MDCFPKACVAAELLQPRNRVLVLKHLTGMFKDFISVNNATGIPEDLQLSCHQADVCLPIVCV